MDVRSTGIAQPPESEERTRSRRQLFYHACIFHMAHVRILRYIVIA